ncbi:MAG: hypothetical protein ABIR46_01030 [Candidatus Saccharimonadales bacterium]
MGSAEDALRARNTAAEAEKRQQEEPLKRQINELWTQIRAEGPSAMERLAQQNYPGGQLVGPAGEERARWEVGRFVRPTQEASPVAPVYLYSDGTVKCEDGHGVLKYMERTSQIQQLTIILGYIKNYPR